MSSSHVRSERLAALIPLLVTLWWLQTNYSLQIIHTQSGNSKTHRNQDADWTRTPMDNYFKSPDQKNESEFKYFFLPINMLVLS